MLIFLVALLALLLAIYWLRCRKIVRLLGALRESLEADQKFLLDRDRYFASQTGFDQLLQTIEEKIQYRRQSYERKASGMDQVEIMFQHMREAVIVLDGSNRIHVCNSAAIRLLGEGKPILEARIEAFLNNPDFNNLLQCVRRDGVQERAQIELYKKGKSIWLEISGAPLSPEAQTKDGMVLFLLNDITHLKKLEAIRRDFVANVSHELRTPITIIKGFADTLYEDGEIIGSEKRKFFTEKIQRNANRMHTLVEDLLALSRLESGAPVLNQTTVIVQEHIKSFVDQYSPLREGLKLHTDLSDQPVYLSLDTSYFRIILENLVSNAEKHGEKTSEIIVRLRKNSESGWYDVEVEDDGIGIPEKEKDRVFQRFYRVDSGRSSKAGGTGLGLSIVKHAVMAHGGRVGVRSSQKGGTVFVCGFPEALPSSDSECTSNNPVAVEKR